MLSKAFEVWKLRSCLGREINCPLLEKFRTSWQLRQLLCVRVWAALWEPWLWVLSSTLLSAAQVHSVPFYFISEFWGFIFNLTCFLSCRLSFYWHCFPNLVVVQKMSEHIIIKYHNFFLLLSFSIKMLN